MSDDLEQFRDRAAGWHSNYAHAHVLDEVNITYAADVRAYHVVFHKIVRNMSATVLDYCYVRIDVCCLPEDPELAQLYRRRPLTLEGVNFRAYTAGNRELKYSIVKQYDSNIELHVRFQDAGTGVRYQLSLGQQIEFFYEILVPDFWWGPWLERHVRCPTMELAVELRFPRRFVQMDAEMFSPDGRSYPLAHAIQRSADANFDIFRWRTVKPGVQERFRFMWAMADGRELRLRDVILAELDAAPSVTSTDHDFRSYTWHKQTFSFTKLQAHCLRVLLAAHPREVGQDFVLEKVESTQDSLLDIFRYDAATKKRGILHPAWGTLIVPGISAGTYRLQLV